MLWALDHGDPERALRLMDAMFAFWLYSSTSFATRRDRLARALTMAWTPTEPDSMRVLAKALNQRGFHLHQTDPDAALALFKQGMALMQRAGDTGRGSREPPRMRGCAHAGGRRRSARPYLLQARAVGHAAGDRQGDAWCEYQLGWAAHLNGNFAEARAQFFTARASFENRGRPSVRMPAGVAGRCEPARRALARRRWSLPRSAR